MVRNRRPKGLIFFDRLPWKKSLPADPEMFPSPTSARRFLPKRRDEQSKVEFWVEEGVVEIRDPRLFRDGQEPFCLALVEETVRPGLAQRVEIRLGSATCRIEFEPGRNDRDELARKVASALKAASLAAKGRSPASGLDHDQARWITLKADASNVGPSIKETLIDGGGHVVCRPRLAINASKISPYSKRPLRNLPRRVRSTPPKARPASLSGRRFLVEPIALAFSSGSIFAKAPRKLVPLFLTVESEADSERMVNLALAGGSFAMGVAGVILPGIPALPFLLLTGHYLIRSSPELCRRLENIPIIGALLEKAESSGSQTIDIPSLMKILGFTVAVLAAFVILHPPLPVVILLETGIMAYYGLREFRKPLRVALPSNLGATMAIVA
jgi:uncharacterized protein